LLAAADGGNLLVDDLGGVHGVLHRRAGPDTEYRWKSTTKNVTTAAGGVVSRCPRVKYAGDPQAIRQP